ncbi:MAG: 4Fe-4S dicluster domain-containing protein [Candidatus Omnitrophica bacterium]|nr:4Fe-4S dicluster domain-containing protein [Candidatus Omnitrophota bacterium]
MSKVYYIESSQLNAFFNRVKEGYKVFSPAIKDKNAKEIDYYYRNINSDTSFVYNSYRTVEPLKSFFTSACEKVTDYFSPEKNITEVAGKAIIFGVKSCDIVGHKIQDFVFLEGVEVDSLYAARRENTILISSDFTDFKEVCHCLAWDILPHPTAGFDLNLSPLNEGYLVEAGSRKGEELIGQYKDYFIPAKEVQISARRTKRDNLIDRLKKHLLTQSLVPKDMVQKIVKEGYSFDTWQQFMLTCVECGGCNLICDTCHCFILADKKESHYQNKKIRVWDSCLYANYARVAGGANPLKTRAARLRNRFMKKFDFFVDNLGMPACCGCGRCIEVCPGKIDIREVLKDLAKKSNNQK